MSLACENILSNLIKLSIMVTKAARLIVIDFCCLLLINLPECAITEFRDIYFLEPAAGLKFSRKNKNWFRNVEGLSYRPRANT